MEKDYDCNSLIEDVRDWDNVIIYGARLIAKNIYGWLKERIPRIHIICFAVSDMTGNLEELYGIPVRCIRELTAYRDNSYVLVAAAEKYAQDIRKTLDTLQFCKYYMITTKLFVDIQTSYLLEFFKKEIPNLRVLPDPYDYMHLNLVETGTQESEVPFARHYKFPVMSELPIEQDQLQYLLQMDYVREFEKVGGEYLNLKRLPAYVEEKFLPEAKVCVYMVRSAADTGVSVNSIYPGYLIPVCAGSGFADDRCEELYDDSGDSISFRNKDFSEMTAMYWIWKNSPHAEYKGLCHYRRHFAVDEKQLLNLNDNQVDVLLTTPKFLFKGIRRFFLEDTVVDEEDMGLLMESIKTLSPEYYETAKWYFEQKFYYPCNMLIARESCFDNYCEWIFPILLRIDDNYRGGGKEKKNRYAGYLAEMLTSLYFVYHEKKYKIAVADILFFEKGRLYVAN